MRSPRDLLRATRPGATPAPGRVKVLVALRQTKAGARVHLENLGMSVEKVVGNKAVGSIDCSALDLLRNDPEVLELDTSVSLKPLAGRRR